MKINRIVVYISFLLPFNGRIQAVSLDGTVNLKYQAAAYAFANGDFARGFVRLNAGLSVPAGATVNFNILTPVAGPINLNTTGQITLEGAMTLDPGVTLANGGKINGQGNTIFLNGDLIVPAGKTLEFTSSTVIDGRGHMLMLSTGSRLYINGPAGTKLTLRNMSLHGVRDYNGIPSIGFANTNQNLTLISMKMFLLKDFSLWAGTLDIYDNVEIYGYYDPTLYPVLQPMLFVYYSPKDIVIHSKATLYLDMTVGFFYSPLDGSNDHFKFIAPSSRLFLNGCALFASEDIGLKLLKGHLIVDHKTTLQSDGRDVVAFQIGNQVPTLDAVIDILPGAQLELEDAFLSYRNKN
ncbi:MAG: hypothetical protein WCW33_02445 [Candidatus Babeliales bacterium]|jgi:hypothetical protein